MADNDPEIPDLVAVLVEDARARVEVLVETTRDRLETEARHLGTDIAERVTELGTALQASLIAGVVAMVAAMLLALAIAATLYAVGIPLYGALWIVTAAALTTMALLLRSAWRSGRRVIAPLAKRPDETASHP